MGRQDLGQDFWGLPSKFTKRSLFPAFNFTSVVPTCHKTHAIRRMQRFNWSYQLGTLAEGLDNLVQRGMWEKATFYMHKLSDNWVSREDQLY